MEDLLNKLIDFLVAERCQKDVFINKNIAPKEGFNTRGFNFLPKENIDGVVCFHGPFSSMDMNIQDILDCHEEIQKYKKKANAVVFRNAIGNDNLYFKFKSLDNMGMPEIIR